MSRAESGDRPATPEGKSVQDWKAAEVAWEKREIAAKMTELRDGLLSHLTAVHRGLGRDPIRYERITALIYRNHPHADGFRLSVELKDRGTTSTTVAAPKDVSVEGAAAEAGKAVIDQRTGRRIQRLKEAMRAIYTVYHKGTEYRRISAILIRSPLPGKITVEVELVAPDGSQRVVIVPETEVRVTGHMLNRA